MTEPPSIHARNLADVFYANGDALAGVVRAFTGRVDGDSDEVIQEAFLKAWRALREGAEPRDLKSWVFTVTINHARDRQRADARRQRRMEPVEPDRTQTADPEPLAQMVRLETLEATQAAIAGLGDGEKEVFLLRVAGELSFREAADALGIPEGTAKTRMRTALQRLRRDLRWFAPGGNPDAHTSPATDETDSPDRRIQP